MSFDLTAAILRQPGKILVISLLILCIPLTISLLAWGGVIGSKTYCIFDKNPEAGNCCSVAGWTDLYCDKCSSENGCDYFSLCLDHLEWTSCCFDHSCENVPNGHLFYVCKTPNVNGEGFQEDPMCGYYTNSFIFLGIVLLAVTITGMISVIGVYIMFKCRNRFNNNNTNNNLSQNQNQNQIQIQNRNQNQNPNENQYTILREVS